MNKLRNPDRRTILKTIGAGVVGSAVTTGPVNATNGESDKEAYGNGNGLGEFLHEEARFKEEPWDGEIADRRGESVVDVAVGSLTSVNVPDPKVPPKAPFGFAPQVVNVSPGTTVRWVWVSNPYDVPIPHDVTSLVDADGDPVLEPHADQRFHFHDQYTPAAVVDGLEEDVNPTHELTFNEPGNHLYYCTPHGAPFEHPGGEHPIHFNVFGMRGAVKVSGSSL